MACTCVPFDGWLRVVIVIVIVTSYHIIWIFYGALNLGSEAQYIYNETTSHKMQNYRNEF